MFDFGELIVNHSRDSRARAMSRETAIRVRILVGFLSLAIEPTLRKSCSMFDFVDLIVNHFKDSRCANHVLRAEVGGVWDATSRFSMAPTIDGPK
jgi:hypothetical protein